LPIRPHGDVKCPEQPPRTRDLPQILPSEPFRAATAGSMPVRG